MEPPGGLPLWVSLAEKGFYGFKSIVCALCCLKTHDLLECPKENIFLKPIKDFKFKHYTVGIAMMIKKRLSQKLRSKFPAIDIQGRKQHINLRRPRCMCRQKFSNKDSRKAWEYVLEKGLLDTVKNLDTGQTTTNTIFVAELGILVVQPIKLKGI
ncbi:hypothetical protein DVH24_001464 [Malus domestica]|uniref:Uncharacterized protein n=1 Tax=Malus domestica TaxID=3750 RepID=A0A498JZ97_MALDO|nr:hypothetical protein DVH24_001464 [Malus domestica]